MDSYWNENERKREGMEAQREGEREEREGKIIQKLMTPQHLIMGTVFS